MISVIKKIQKNKEPMIYNNLLHNNWKFKLNKTNYRTADSYSYIPMYDSSQGNKTKLLVPEINNPSIFDESKEEVNKVLFRKNTYENFKKNDNKNVRRSGIVFIQPNDDIEKTKILVVKGLSSGIWSLPKGRMMPEETEEKCAIREVYEETGIVINTLEDFPKCKIGKNTYYKYVCYDEEFTEFNIQDKNEVECVEWKTMEELRELNCNKDLRSLLLYPEKKYSYHYVIF
jgi:8-oxo-dGTP pyrophosphatase MutT (NUDIX family)